MHATAIRQINKNHRGYYIPGCSVNTHPKINAIVPSRANTIKHELAKALGAIMLQRFGDVKFTPEIISALNELDYQVGMLGFSPQESKFITEAVPRHAPKRRIDLVDLRDNTHYEFENDPSIKKHGAITIYI